MGGRGFPCSWLCPCFQRVFVLGTPGIRLEAIINQGIIWLLNGLLTKVCMMQSQVWPGGGSQA